MSLTNRTDFYLDFQQFSDLKLGARENSKDAAKIVAQQFEGLFVQQMLASMRSASRIDEGQHSSQMDFYHDMYDKQLAQTIAGQDRLGVARLLMRQMPGADNADAMPDEIVPAVKNDLAAVSVPVEAKPAMPPAPVAASVPVEAKPAMPPAPAAASVPVEAKPAIPPAPAVASMPVETKPTMPPSPATGSGGVRLGRVVDDDFAELAQIESTARRWNSPQTFVTDIWPDARLAAKELGVSPGLLVAQAALETGWGKHAMKFDDGRNSYNLFGIKAGSGWRGGALDRTSLEFSGGVLQNRVSRFRAYASPAQSMADYVDLIRSSPRYQPALSLAGDDQGYIRAIQDAGYATDPNYADKIIGILNGDMLQQTLAGLETGETGYV